MSPSFSRSLLDVEDKTGQDLKRWCQNITLKAKGGTHAQIILLRFARSLQSPAVSATMDLSLHLVDHHCARLCLNFRPQDLSLGLALAILIYLIGRSSGSRWMKRRGIGPFLFLGFIVSFALRWHIALQAQVKVYQIFRQEKQGVRPLTLKGQIDEDFSFRINKPLRQDEQSWFLIPFRLDDGPRLELGISAEQWELVKHATRFEVTGKPAPLRCAANPCSYEAHLIGAGRGFTYGSMSCLVGHSRGKGSGCSAQGIANVYTTI